MTSAAIAVVPDSPSELGLPFAEWRPYQREAVQECYDALQSHDTVLMEAPTGAGKSLIGAALSRMLGAGGGRGLYLSSTKSLQTQYLGTLEGAVTATGRANHSCLKVNPKTALAYQDASEAPCPCPLALPSQEGGCSYYGQWFGAARSADAVLNYAYAVRVMQARGLRVAQAAYGLPGYNVRLNNKGRAYLPNPFSGRDLMVCDEAHTLEGALLQAATVELYRSTFEHVGLSMPTAYSVEMYADWASESLGSMESRLEESEGEISRLQEQGMDPSDTFIESVKQLRRAAEALGQADGVLAFADPEDLVIARTNYGVNIKPIWITHQAKSLLFQYAPKRLLMSATLGNPQVLSKILGLDPDAYAHVVMPSTFPVTNRPVYVWPVAQMKHNMLVEDKARQAVAIITLAKKASFLGQPGVVHCASYDLGRFLVDCIRQYDPEVGRRLVTHTAADRAATFDAFEAAGNNQDSILVTPSATTGVDWDFVGWQVIPKVPYPNLGDDFVRTRYEYQTEGGDPLGKKVFSNEAATSIVQAAGRCVRTPTSKGVTVITDAAFRGLYYGAKDCFPQWFRAAVSFDSTLNQRANL